jgi:hypothetical protein
MMGSICSPKHRFLQESHGVASQKTEFFIVIAVKIPNLIYLKSSLRRFWPICPSSGVTILVLGQAPHSFILTWSCTCSPLYTFVMGRCSWAIYMSLWYRQHKNNDPYTYKYMPLGVLTLRPSHWSWFYHLNSFTSNISFATTLLCNLYWPRVVSVWYRQIHQPTKPLNMSMQLSTQCSQGTW